ncbi:MAG: alpha-1,2-fucosyltransferase [Actinobacteria bacterium]|nr:MAG: alpha-1,2-fucosyltransferase [Actinomycetota bacterium]
MPARVGNSSPVGSGTQRTRSSGHLKGRCETTCKLRIGLTCMSAPRTAQRSVGKSFSCAGMTMSIGAMALTARRQDAGLTRSPAAWGPGTIVAVISVDTGGFLGNQMFQLAFAHVASRRLGTTFNLSSAPAKSLWENFELGEWGDPAVRRRRRLAYKLRHPRPRIVVVDNERDDPESVLSNLRDGARYTGFYQSERYFVGYEDEVKQMFTVRAEHRAEFTRRYGDRGPYACVHVRRRDYLETPWALPASFYYDALGTDAEITGMPVIVVSDDPGAVRGELGDIDDVQFESNPAIIDLQLLMHADVVVASASSFSWWGAWLNRKPDCRVLVPQHWLGFAKGEEEPRGVLPERWIQVPVREPSVTAGEAA